MVPFIEVLSSKSKKSEVQIYAQAMGWTNSIKQKNTKIK